MPIVVDSSFCIGQAHRVCQDYGCHCTVKTESGGPLHLAVLADGCSSSPHTDIGARILTLAFVRVMARSYDRLLRDATGAEERHAIRALEMLVVEQALMAVRVQALDTRCLDATLLGVVSDGRRVRVLAWGDGAIHARQVNSGGDTAIAWLLENSGAAPYYLSYLLDPGRRAAYHDTYGWPSGLTVSTIGEDGLGGAEQAEERPTENLSFYAVWEHAAGEELTVSVLSDGVASVCQAASRAVASEKCVRELTAFKNRHGEFVHRRLSRFIKDARRQGWIWFDDIAVASLHVTPEPEACVH